MERIRNLKAFVAGYLKSHNGQKALARKPIRERQDNGKFVFKWHNPAIAEAFKEAVR